MVQVILQCKIEQDSFPAPQIQTVDRMSQGNPKHLLPMRYREYIIT
jgi:hypothetical protein